LKVLFIGDIVGNPGRKAAKEIIKVIKKENPFDICIANCENAAGGRGITYVVAQEIYKFGVDVITMGNHVWAKNEILNFIDSDPMIIRPANYPENLPGRGSTIFETSNGKIGIVNLVGRVFMDSVDCPFRAADREIEILKKSVKLIVVDMHAEATSEKNALAWNLDGRVSCVVGTHTHVQTADERILPCGTGFISDVGMTGPHEGIIGVRRDIIIDRFITHMPSRYEVENTGKLQFNGVFLELDNKNGKTLSIERISRIFDI